MKRYKLTVSYDGTAYCGWQVQPNGITIEGVLNQALTDLLGQEVQVIGASRTDSGVHALGNVCVFDAETRIPADKLKMALNQRLPEDIRVRESFEVADDFHPRHADTVKTYEYKIYNDRIENPLYRLYSKFCYIPLDTEKMQEAASYIVGEHDFTAFCSAGSSVVDKTRTIYSCDIIVHDVSDSNVSDSNVSDSDKSDSETHYPGMNDSDMSYSGSAICENNKDSEAAGIISSDNENRDEVWRGRMITIRITGNGFLYNMVRIIAGTLMEVGSGRLAPEAVKEIIESKDRSRAGDTAEARGLTLVEIRYL